MFSFVNLDEKTRAYMLDAISEAQASDNIYYSQRFNSAGRQQWLSLLKAAAMNHNEHWLAYQLEAKALMRGFEDRRKPSGGYTIRHVPHSAAETMAEGQFNRFYMLGLCKRAKSEGILHLEVYRAKERSSPRSESQVLVGTRIPVDEVEAQLSETSSSLKSSLMKPNSGISVKLP